MLVILFILGYIVWGCVWGVIVNSVISDKNYNENWFWWGFFFNGIALRVACSKPQNTYTYSPYPGIGLTSEKRRERDLLQDDGWRCSRCGTVNPNYTGSCGCGMSRYENDRVGQEVKQDRFEEIKKYKELLDCGIINQEEFDKKKKELLIL